MPCSAVESYSIVANVAQMPTKMYQAQEMKKECRTPPAQVCQSLAPCLFSQRRERVMLLAQNICNK